MDPDLEEIHRRIMSADKPEDLFGSEDIVLQKGMLQEYLDRRHEKLRTASNPRRYQAPEDIEAADEASAKLSRLYRDAMRRIENATYGLKGLSALPPNLRSFAVGSRTYYIGAQCGEGENGLLYQGFLVEGGNYIGEIRLKIARESSRSLAIENEVRILDLLHQREVPQWRHLPIVLDRFKVKERVGLVLRGVSGHSMRVVRHHRTHLNGVDQKHMVWMIDRTLSALGYVHSCGIVHGNLNPDHLIVQPESHNVLLCGWAAAVYKPAISGERSSLIEAPWTAPEIRESGQIGPWSDIYSLGKLMIWLLGGDPATNEIPLGVEEPISKFLHRMVLENHKTRPSDAWELYEEQARIKDVLWPRKFLHFDMA